MVTYEYDKMIGNQIRICREYNNWTQEQLSAKLQTVGCDITRSALAKIEVGQRHLYVSEIKAIKTILNTDYDDLFV
jgi:transcriptional regulator with XRE-family HTH domain